MKLRGLAYAWVILGYSGLAVAHEQTIGDETKCLTVTSIMERQPPDKEQQQEALQYVVGSMRALDRAYALKGKGEILAKMTEEGQNAVALVALNRCKTRGDLPVEDVAFDTYRSIRMMQSILGFGNKPQAKLVNPRAPKRRSVQASRSDAALR
jgi:hypothetical protein